MYASCTADGRIHFTVPKLFNTSLCLLGADKDDGWFFVSAEFLINVGGDLTGLQGTLNDEWYIHFLFVQQQCRVPANTFRNHKTTYHR